MRVLQALLRLPGLWVRLPMLLVWLVMLVPLLLLEGCMPLLALLEAMVV